MYFLAGILLLSCSIAEAANCRESLEGHRLCVGDRVFNQGAASSQQLTGHIKEVGRKGFKLVYTDGTSKWEQYPSKFIANHTCKKLGPLNFCQGDFVTLTDELTNGHLRDRDVSITHLVEHTYNGNNKVLSVVGNMRDGGIVIKNLIAVKSGVLPDIPSLRVGDRTKRGDLILAHLVGHSSLYRIEKYDQSEIYTVPLQKLLVLNGATELKISIDDKDIIHRGDPTDQPSLRERFKKRFLRECSYYFESEDVEAHDLKIEIGEPRRDVRISPSFPVPIPSLVITTIVKYKVEGVCRLKR